MYALDVRGKVTNDRDIPLQLTHNLTERDPS